ncbi:permease-like cell division protein FtsX [[Clostridium] leptum]|nr:permease-like cell division protein FtsX [[Clostridium] leptum]
MKASNFRYLIKEGFRSVWVNRNMALASVGVLTACLLLLGSVLLCVLNIDEAFQWLEKQNIAMVYVQDSASEQQTAQLGEDISKMDNIESCIFVSKEEGLDKQLEAFGDDAELLESLKDDNPLPDAYQVSVKDLSLYDQTIDEIKSMSGVESVASNRDEAETMTHVRNVVSNVGGWVIGILVIVSLFIIANTVKITMFVRRLEISIMKSVGATNAFITIPFLVQGMFLGLFSAALASGIIWYLYYLAAGAVEGIMPTLSVIPFSQVALPIILIFVGAGVLTGTIGSAISIRRHLKHDARGIYDVI